MAQISNLKDLANGICSRPARRLHDHVLVSRNRVKSALLPKTGEKILRLSIARHRQGLSLPRIPLFGLLRLLSSSQKTSQNIVLHQRIISKIAISYGSLGTHHTIPMHCNTRANSIAQPIQPYKQCYSPRWMLEERPRSQ